jgi:hypothetical protein
MAKLLVGSGAEINDFSIRRPWPKVDELIVAVFMNRRVLTSLFLEMDADLKVYSRETLTQAVREASFHWPSKIDIFYLLLDHIVKMQSKEEVIKNMWGMISNIQCYDEVADTLIKRNLDINQKDKYGRALLSSIASQLRMRLNFEGIDRHLIPKLLEMGARLSSVQMVDCTLLTASIEIPSLTFIEAYLERGAEPNERDGKGYTPLLAAAHCWGKKHDSLLLYALLKNGADVTAKDPDGNTVLEVLLIRGFRSAPKYLAEWGATVSERHIELLPMLQEEEKIEEDRPRKEILYQSRVWRLRSQLEVKAVGCFYGLPCYSCYSCGSILPLS